MDIETSEVIDRIGARIDALDASLRAEFRAEFSSVREEFRGEFSSVREEFRGEFSSVREEFRAEFSSVREEFREGLAQNRRHTEVLFESLRDDIRILADGFAAVSTKLDSLQR